ncbi:MAG TPA: 1,2-phenylacetyl-CoA epoxidase subunit PaaC [Candidatus Limnocylindria bacterium]|nr:1,2-phenylacetyl-CoA epoxidase subunit PaaC [Candidatus Limnocylindria bacterium]
MTAIGQPASPTTGAVQAGNSAAVALAEPTRTALAELLLAMADDEFVSGFTDSEWTGIAPLLEEDVAISSISQDELGHARALYQLLADVVADGRDEDALAYDRELEEYRHARLLDQPRGDWADTIARRFLYELADEARLASIGGEYRPLADLVEKLRREERYHRMHVLAWIERLARGGPEPRRRLEAALTTLGADAPTVFTPLAGEAALLDAGILTRSIAAAEAAWRADLTTILVPLGLALPPEVHPGADGRQGHSDSFRWLWGEFTMVRRSEDGATW